MQRHNSLYASRFSNSRLRGGAVAAGGLNAQVAAAPSVAAAAPAPEQGLMAVALNGANAALNAALAAPNAATDPAVYGAAVVAAQRAQRLAGDLGGVVGAGDAAVADAILNAVTASRDAATLAQAARLGAEAAASAAKDNALGQLTGDLQAYHVAGADAMDAALAQLRGQLNTTTQEVNDVTVVAPTAVQQAALAAGGVDVADILRTHVVLRSSKQIAEAAIARADAAAGNLAALGAQFQGYQAGEQARRAEKVAAREAAAAREAEAAAARDAAAREAEAREAAAVAAAATPAARAAAAAAERRAQIQAWMAAPRQGGGLSRFRGGAAAPAAVGAPRTPADAFTEAKEIMDALNGLTVSPATFNYVPPAGATVTKDDIITEIVPSLDSGNTGRNLWSKLILVLNDVEKPFNGKNMMHVPKSEEIVARAIAVAVNGHLPISAVALFYGDYYQNITPTQISQYKALFAVNADVASKWDRQVDNIRRVISSYNKAGSLDDTIPADRRLNGPGLVRLSTLSNFVSDLKGKVVTKRNTPPTSGVSGAMDAVRSLVLAAAPGGMRGGNSSAHAPLYPNMVMKGGAHPFARFYGGDVDAVKVLTTKIDRLLARYKELTKTELAGNLKSDITSYSDQVKNNLEGINKSLEVLYNGNQAIARFPPGLGSSFPATRAEIESYGNKIAELNKAADKTAKRLVKLTDIHDLVADLVSKLEAQSPAKFA